MRKRLFALLLAMTLVFAMALPASAVVWYTDGNGNPQIVIMDQGVLKVWFSANDIQALPIGGEIYQITSAKYPALNKDDLLILETNNAGRFKIGLPMIPIANYTPTFIEPYMPTTTAPAVVQPQVKSVTQKVQAPVTKLASPIGTENWTWAPKKTTSTNVNVIAPVCGSSGLSGTGSVAGSSIYTNWDNGLSSTTNRIGNFDYTNYSNGLNSTTSRIGNFNYTNFSDGASVMKNRVGNFDYYTGSDGSSGTGYWIGNTYYYNGR